MSYAVGIIYLNNLRINQLSCQSYGINISELISEFFRDSVLPYTLKFRGCCTFLSLPVS